MMKNGDAGIFSVYYYSLNTENNNQHDNNSKQLTIAEGNTPDFSVFPPGFVSLQRTC